MFQRAKKFDLPIEPCMFCGCETDLILVVDAGINHFHQIPDREWFETEAVLRVSLGNFLFFTILSVVMIGVKSQKDPRDSIHHGGWMMKVTCWLLLVIFSMFFVPNEIISFYGKHCFYQEICFRGAYKFPYFLLKAPSYTNTKSNELHCLCAQCTMGFGTLGVLRRTRAMLNLNTCIDNLDLIITTSLSLPLSLSSNELLNFEHIRSIFTMNLLLK